VFHTCNLEVFDAVYIEPFVNYSTLVAGLHGTGAALQRSVEQIINIETSTNIPNARRFHQLKKSRIKSSLD
jgi:hypothetical protein